MLKYGKVEMRTFCFVGGWASEVPSARGGAQCTPVGTGIEGALCPGRRAILQGCQVLGAFCGTNEEGHHEITPTDSFRSLRDANAWLRSQLCHFAEPEEAGGGVSCAVPRGPPTPALCLLLWGSKRWTINGKTSWSVRHR